MTYMIGLSVTTWNTSISMVSVYRLVVVTR